MNPPLFWILAAVAVVSALGVISKRNPLGSALALAVNLTALAGLFAGLSAPFLFIIQILVYVGAVVVLIVFVIMLLNLRPEEMRDLAIQRGKFAASAVLCLAAAALLVRGVSAGAGGAAGAGGSAAGAAGGVQASGAMAAAAGVAAIPSDFGSVEAMADLLFTRYLLPFEVVSILLLVGIVGAIVLAKKGE